MKAHRVLAYTVLAGGMAGGWAGSVHSGPGFTLLFATNPCYRWQNLGEFNMLANAILYSGGTRP
jgi:hypothetical protein